MDAKFAEAHPLLVFYGCDEEAAELLEHWNQGSPASSSTRDLFRCVPPWRFPRIPICLHFQTTTDSDAATDVPHWSPATSIVPAGLLSNTTNVAAKTASAVAPQPAIRSVHAPCAIAPTAAPGPDHNLWI